MTPDELMDNFGPNLARLRAAKYKNVFQFSQASGVAYQSIKRFERGDGWPSMLTLVKIAIALTGSLDDLVIPPASPDRDKGNRESTQAERGSSHEA